MTDINNLEQEELTEKGEYDDGSLTKERILEQYREENVNGDERVKSGIISAGNIAFTVGIWIAAIISIVYRILGLDTPYEMDLIWFSMWSIHSFICYIKQRKIGQLIFGIIGALGAILSLVLLILTLMGVL